jgi:hypothetical protein
MAKNAKSAGRGEGYRDGSVKNRSQFKHKNGTWFKRDTKTGQIMSGQDTPHKGVANEPDGRRNPE